MSTSSLRGLRNLLTEELGRRRADLERAGAGRMMRPGLTRLMQFAPTRHGSGRSVNYNCSCTAALATYLFGYPGVRLLGDYGI